MDETWQSSGAPTAPPPPSGRDPWRRRPHRSITDRKIAGVAGGLGRALRIDPIVLRVLFVVLTIFGGFGALLYVLGWLLLPDDRDEVSAGEALLGRGRSSVPPVLAVVLAVIAVASLFSMFSWGLPFLPVVIAAVVITVVVQKKRRCAMRRGGSTSWSNGWNDGQGWERRADQWDRHAERNARRMAQRSDRWEQQAQQWADQVARHAERFAQRAQRWGQQAEQWGGRPGQHGPHGHHGQHGPAEQSGPRGASPFEQPAFWDRPEDRRSGPQQPADRVDLSKHDTAGGATVDPLLDPYDTAHRTPPAWDPLGVAPFAWDLPEPSAPAPSAPTPATRVRHRGLGVLGRVTISLALLSAGLLAAGIFAGWWAFPWAVVTGVALGVVGLGLLVGAFAGRGRALIPLGVFLSLVTIALGVTGIQGTSGFGNEHWQPTSLADVAKPFQVQAGHGDLDLSNLSVPAGQTADVTLIVRAGRADVTLPQGVTTNLTCQAGAGSFDCLGKQQDGTDQNSTQVVQGDAEHGTLNVSVQVKAGYAEVRND
jgi:phage shock protein PspC (stress-responsive transcriptional regulator)